MKKKICISVIALTLLSGTAMAEETIQEDIVPQQETVTILGESEGEQNVETSEIREAQKQRFRNGKIDEKIREYLHWTYEQGNARIFTSFVGVLQYMMPENFEELNGWESWTLEDMIEFSAEHPNIGKCMNNTEKEIMRAALADEMNYNSNQPMQDMIEAQNEFVNQLSIREATHRKMIYHLEEKNVKDRENREAGTTPWYQGVVDWFYYWFLTPDTETPVNAASRR